MSITLERPATSLRTRLAGLNTRPDGYPESAPRPPAPPAPPVAPLAQPAAMMLRAQMMAEMEAALDELRATSAWQYGTSFSPSTIAERERYYEARARYDRAAQQYLAHEARGEARL